MSKALAFVLVLLVGTGLSAHTFAGPLTAAELSRDQAILSQFGLVVFGQYNANNESEGPVAVGGNLVASTPHNIGQNGNGFNPVVAGASFGVANVYGSVTGGFNPIGGNTYVGGTIENGQFNNLGNQSFDVVGGVTPDTTVAGGTLTQIRTAQPSFAGTAQNVPAGNVHAGLPATSVFPFGSFAAAFQTPLSDLAQSLLTLAAQPGVTPQAFHPQDNVALKADTVFTRNGKKYGLFETTLAVLTSVRNFEGIDDGGNDATFVVVTGNAAGALPVLNGNTSQRKVIYDFVDATSLRFGGQWFGTVLAPNATVSDPYNLTGTYVFGSFTQGGELHENGGYQFGGDLTGLGTSVPIPEPASLGIVAACLFGLGVSRSGLWRSGLWRLGLWRSIASGNRVSQWMEEPLASDLVVADRALACLRQQPCR